MIDYMEWRRQKLSEGWFDQGMFMNPNAKTTKVKPVKSVCVLFKSLKGGKIQRTFLEGILFAIAQSKDNPPRCKDGYLSSMIGYHRACGRLKRSREDRNVFYSLTEKGKKYATERGIF